MTGMKKIVLAFLGLTCSSPALAYDDPAVAVCEYAKFRGEDPIKTGFTRTGAYIDGHKVTLDYERSVLNIKPKRSRWECEFKIEDGMFHLEIKTSKLDERCRGHKIALSQVGLDFDERVKRHGVYDAVCASQAQIAIQNPAVWRNEIEGPLTRLDVYPILPADTELEP
jgi:hypothetical protein